MNQQHDVIVIGAGHNGLVCAAYLARAGRSVLVLEAGLAVGGGAVTQEIAPGFNISSCAHLIHQLHPRVVQELALHRHGLEYVQSGLPTVALASDGGHLTLAANALVGAAATSDIDEFPEFTDKINSYASILKSTLDKLPPRLGTQNWSDRVSLIKLGWGIRRLGREHMQEFLRIVGMNIADLLEETFGSDLLRGALAWDAVVGSHLGPRSPGSVLTYLHRVAAESAAGLAIPKGGVGAVSAALASAATSAGAEIRTHSPVARVVMESERTRGVRLESGEEIRADTVVSNADPRLSFLTLVGTEYLDTEFVRRVLNIRMKGVTAKLNLALSALPAFNGLDQEAAGARLLVTPGIDYLERAFNHVKYGEYSEAPGLEISVPSIHDNSLAPHGQHVMSVVAQYTPYDLKAGWDPASRERFADLIVQRIAAYAPDLPACIEARQLVTPLDLERDFRMTGGHWHHGELAFDQFMMMRPVPGASQYSTPIPDFYLCGAGSHPGGGIIGAAGMNAARRIISMETSVLSRK